MPQHDERKILDEGRFPCERLADHRPDLRPGFGPDVCKGMAQCVRLAAKDGLETVVVKRRQLSSPQVDEYAERSGDPVPLVRAKRIIGILLAKLVIIAITPKRMWSSSGDHPPVKDRVRGLMLEIDEDAPPSLWALCAELLAVFARYYGLITEPIEFKSIPELVLRLVELFDVRTESPSDAGR